MENKVNCPLCKKEIERNDYGICDECRTKLDVI